MSIYQQIPQQIKSLNPEEQVCLLEELTAIVHNPTPAQPKRTIMELEGLGKEIWQGIDAQEYINRERDSWNG